MHAKGTGSGHPMRFATLLLIPFLLFAAGTRVSADAGPKPSLVIRTVGSPGAEAFYLDALVEEDGEGIAEPGEKSWYEDDHAWVVDQPIYLYDEGGRVGLTCHGIGVWGDLEGKRTGMGAVEHQFGYMFIPRTFAVIVQDRSSGALRVSNTITTTQFDALVQYDFAENRLTVLQNTGSFWWWAKFLFRIFATLLVECLLVFAFRFPRRRWLPIPVNFATQGLLNLLLVALVPGMFQMNYLLAFGVLEGVVAVLEFLAYFFWMADRRFWKPFLYALIANGITLAIGLWWVA